VHAFKRLTTRFGDRLAAELTFGGAFALSDRLSYPLNAVIDGAIDLFLYCAF
jgi:hypothetical protein